jgi:hypothetical protein
VSADESQPARVEPHKPAGARPRKRRRLRHVAAALVGTLLGLGIAEAAFWWRDERAFPHLNAYLSDADLGTRLEPGASGRVQVARGRVTAFRINAAGFRGAELPTPVRDEVLVVGDSQVFGLGVEESETFAARLAERSGRSVINAGVPTYGPPEYHAVSARLLAERKSGTLVYVVNVANDLFEAQRPNRERHAVWDGWAVRIETAPLSQRSFPGRELLFRHSHLVFAWRKFWYEELHPDLDDAAFPSEGGFADLVALGGAAERLHASEREETLVQAALRPLELDEIEHQALRAQLALEQVIYDEIVGNDGNQALLLRAARATPGDIVTTGPGEEAAPLSATAKLIREGSAYRKELEDKLRAIAARAADAALKKRIDDSLATRDALAEKLMRLRAAPLHAAQSTSPLAEPLKKLKKLCDDHQTELVVLILPLDVQVSDDEWSKYGSERVDMRPTRVLIDDAVALAESLGVRVLDATQTLARGEPGAFLPADLHLSAKGHDRVAAALADKMAEPPPRVRTPGLPAGRSRVPRFSDWRKRRELLVSGSDAARCDTWLRNEWLLVHCRHVVVTADSPSSDKYTYGVGAGPKPVGIVVLEGNEGEVVTTANDGAMALVAPIFRGKKLVADFFWEDHRRRLTVDWPASEPVANEITLEKLVDPGKAPALAAAPGSEALCSCFEKVSGAASCSELLGVANEDCTRTYGADCEGLVGCASGNPLFPPRCQGGRVNALAGERCLLPCDKSKSCKEGSCRPWQGLDVCVP